MDPFDAFYQQLDSKTLLDRHHQQLLADARAKLAESPEQRVGGIIFCADSPHEVQLRQDMAKATDQPVAASDIVGICSRPMIESALSQLGMDERWREEPWQPQRVLPVMVSTRDGVRFGFFPLGERSLGAEESG